MSADDATNIFNLIFCVGCVLAFGLGFIGGQQR